MKDIKVKSKKVSRIIKKEIQNTSLKSNSIKTTKYSIFFEKEKVFAISCFSACIFSACTYIFAITSITFFAVQERNFSHKYEKLLVEYVALKTPEEIVSEDSQNQNFNLDTKKITHLTFIDTNVSDQNLTRK